VDSVLKAFSPSDNGSDAAFLDDDILESTYFAIMGAISLMPQPHSTPVTLDQFRKNAKDSASGFSDLMRKALQGNDLNLWYPVVTHGTFPTYSGPLH
jgi:hypothetical protein